MDERGVFVTPMKRVIAADAESGEERWIYDPTQRQTKLPGPHSRVCRGIAYWEAESATGRDTGADWEKWFADGRR